MREEDIKALFMVALALCVAAGLYIGWHIAEWLR